VRTGVAERGGSSVTHSWIVRGMQCWLKAIWGGGYCCRNCALVSVGAAAWHCIAPHHMQPGSGRSALWCVVTAIAKGGHNQMPSAQFKIVGTLAVLKITAPHMPSNLRR